MSWSKIAFGAAKCAKGVVEHEAAFARALKGGVTGETAAGTNMSASEFCDQINDSVMGERYSK